MITKRITKNTTPLCFLSDDKLVCYQKGDIVVLDSGIELQRIRLLGGVKEWLLGRCNITSRLLRLGVRASLALNEEIIILSIVNVLYELNLSTGKLSKGWCCRAGVRPLILSEIKDIKGFEDGVYFGEYYKNDAIEPINVYHRIGEDRWDVAYTFQKGAIKHVHNIIPDSYRQCVWIMTGDFGDAAAIWKATDGFKKVERVVFGEQKWRGCVGFAIPEGLLYATDTPFSDNHIFLLKPNGSVETIGDLSGSCIYGCQWKEKFVFSSTVEADGRDETMWKLLTSKKRGCGIKDNYVRLYVGNLSNGFQEVYKEKKDWLPFIFQFGAFRFPAGVNNTDMLYFQPVATSRQDLCLMGIKTH